MLASQGYVESYAHGVQWGVFAPIGRVVACVTSKSMLLVLVMTSAMTVVQVRYLTKSSFIHLSKVDVRSKKLQTKIEYARSKKQHLLRLSSVSSAAKQRGMQKPMKKHVQFLGV